MKRTVRTSKQNAVLAESAAVFFIIFVLTYLVPGEEFKRNAKALLIAFTVSRVILKFTIFIPYKEFLAEYEYR